MQKSENKIKEKKNSNAKFPLYGVIGSNSYIGSVFFKEFKKNILVSTVKNKKKKFIKFDILKDNINSILKSSCISHLVLFAGETNINKCFKNSNLANKLNFLAPKKIILYCVKKNIIPIIFSSDSVFDGTKSYYKESSRQTPILNYGIQKSKLERFVINNKLPVLILRLSKVYGIKKSKKDFIWSLVDQIKKKRSMFVANDQFFCPVFVGDVINLINICAKKKLIGIYNLSSKDKTSRFQIANKIKYFLKSSSIIKPCSINKFFSYEQRPKDISLCNKKIINITRYKMKSIDSHLKKILL
jgi:dTDP-4-dehydrorhamnose reductase